MKISTKIVASFSIAFLCVALIVGFSIDTYVSSVIKDEVTSSLIKQNFDLSENVRTLIQDQKITSNLLAAASIYRDFLKEPVTNVAYGDLKTKIVDRLARTLASDPVIYEAFILDSNGKVVASSDSKQEGVDKSTKDYFIHAKKSVYFSDLNLSPTLGIVNYLIASPVIDDKGTLLGISVLRYLPERLNAIAQKEIKTLDTQESFLINKDKFFITPSRFLGIDVVLKQKVITKNTNDCFDPNEMDYVRKKGYIGFIKTFGDQIVTALDYRNISVIATHAFIPETGWCLITKVDQTDLLSYRFPLIAILTGLFSFGLLLFFIVGLLISKKITKSISILSEGIEKIIHGNFSLRVGMKTQDEIGNLSRSFETMVSSLKEATSDTEKKIREQTQDIQNQKLDLINQKNALLNILEDVEEEKKRSEVLSNDLRKFKMAVDSASDQVVIADPEGIVVYGNPAVLTITGYKPEEALGKKAAALWKMPMPLEYYQKLWNVIKIQKKVFVGEVQNRRKNGELYIANIAISPVLNDQGEVVYLVAIEHDITKEKDIDRAKTEFVSLASHQLRTPLSSINWYTEMLLAGDAGKINKEQKKYLDEIYRGNQRMVDLVNALLNVSRLELGTFMVDPEPTDIIEISKSIVQEMHPTVEKKEIVIKEKYEKKLPKVNVDPKLTRIVFQNLVSNAVKYTPEKGKVEVRIELRKKGDDVEGTKIKADSIFIAVSDTGYGIPKAQQGKIFTKLFRADNVRAKDTEGTGLGLYIVKSIVEGSGGNVWFTSVEDTGTTFFVVLPLTGMQKKVGTKSLG